VSSLALRRLLWTFLALLAAAVLLTARLLAPRAEGVGTHLALGLPPCGFLLWFELPCPTCGLTTAFAHLARFELLRSLRAQPLGLPLFAATLLTVPLALRAALSGASAASLVERFQLDRWALGLVAALLLTWLARLAPLLTR
jgi:hypothetical protein